MTQVPAGTTAAPPSLPAIRGTEPVAGGADVRETHSAVVLLCGDRAYKVKKPVSLGFLDFSTPSLRKAACRRELELNRRMAPDVYLEVLDVVDGGGQQQDSVLVMRRMPEDRRLATLVRHRADVSGGMRQLAKQVATFHATARTNAEISSAGSPAALAERWRSNLTGLRERAPSRVPAHVLDEVEELAGAYLAGRVALLEERMRARWVRDVHGDLLADDIFLLPTGPEVLDCLDFDDRLRWMDVVDDVASLVMDLERLGAADVGTQLVHDYHEFSGAVEPMSLSHHYVAYRAVMRAKIAAIREDTTSDGARAEASLEAEALTLLGLRHLRAGLPRLVLVGGAPASGKSTIAEDRDMGPIARYLGPEVAAEQLIWQDPLPAPAEAPLDRDAVEQLKSRVLAAGIPTADLVWLAWSSASTFRHSDKRGGANGARIRLEPQNGWAVNEPHRLVGLLRRLDGIRADFASARPEGHGVSMADLIVLAGTAAVEKAAADAGHAVPVAFSPGRVDAAQDDTDIDGFSYLEPASDGFRNYPGKDTLPAEYRLVDRADLLALSAQHLTALVGGLRTLGATYQGAATGVLTATPGVLTNDWFVNLLDQNTSWAPTAHDPALYEGRDRTTGAVRWSASRADLVFGSNAELRALAEVYASADGAAKFVEDFTTAWARVMDLDRFDLRERTRT